MYDTDDGCRQRGKAGHGGVEQGQHGTDVRRQAFAIVDELANIPTCAKPRASGTDQHDTRFTQDKSINGFDQRLAKGQVDSIAFVRSIENEVIYARFDAV
ncbi:hypothetical protein D3C85_1366080 [compost metagenome]